MRHNLFLLFPAFLVGADAQPPSVQGLLETLRAQSKVPGMAAAVVRDGRIIASGVTGVREAGKPDPIQLGDRFVVGSCTKAMTRLLLLRLAEAGKLRFDLTLKEAFPGVPMHPGYETATVQDLLSHTAGLPPYTRITPKDTPIVFSVTGSPQEKRTQFAAHVLGEAPRVGSAKKFLYSNAGFALLGNLVERREGKPWEALIAREVFQPLGMSAAVIGIRDAQAAGPIPEGHEPGPSGFQPAGGPPVAGLFAPAGGAVLPIEDFARFALGQLAAEAPTRKSRVSLKPGDSTGGEGEVLLGGQGTFTAGFAVWPSAGFGVVVATNGGEADQACIDAIAALRAAFAPELPAPTDRPGPAKGRPLGLQLRAEEGGPLFLAEVAPGSRAQKAGLQAGDEVLALNGKVVKDLDQDGVRTELQTPSPRFRVLRGGKVVECVMPKE